MAELSRMAFIEAATEMIESEGIESLSIRKLAKKLDCSTGNIYYYFKNLDEVMAYACMGYYASYLADMSILYAEQGYTLKAYEESWKIYIDHVFAFPEIFMKLIYGPYSRRLSEISSEYYALFPEKRKKLNSPIAKNLMEDGLRTSDDHLVLGSCVKAGTITRENADILGYMLRTMTRGALCDIQDKTDDAYTENVKKQLLESVHILINLLFR